MKQHVHRWRITPVTGAETLDAKCVATKSCKATRTFQAYLPKKAEWRAKRIR